MRKQLYKLHRTLSIVIALPVILWAGTGILHPVMTNIRPEISSQQLEEKPIDSTDVVVPLQQALTSNAVKSFRQVRLVYIDSALFYQVQRDDVHMRYINTKTGAVLPQGDTVYAKYLAHQFLVAGKQQTQPMVEGHHHDHGAMIASRNARQHDANVRSVDDVVSFDSQYSSINRLLPVYKVSFDRADGVVIYVDTRQSRFAFATNHSRQVLSGIFAAIHTWGWVSFMGRGKTLVEILVSGIAFVTSVLGIVIFFLSRDTGGERNRARRNHRYTAIAVSLFTLMFSFSGCLHVTAKLDKRADSMPVKHESFDASMNADVTEILRVAPGPVSDLQLVKINGHVYWRATMDNAKGRGAKDLMKDQHVTADHVVYIDVIHHSILVTGDAHYAESLARYFGMGHANGNATMITHFTDEYSFADKLLPVWKIDDGQAQYFIETSSGGLSKVSSGGISYEEMSFAFLHKHEFLSGFGKRVKDFSTTFWAFAQIVMVVFGVILFVKIRRRNDNLQQF